MQDLAILKSDIELIKKLSSRKYPKSLKGLISPVEEQSFKKLQEKLKTISDKTKHQYDTYYGPFNSERSKGNPVNRAGALRRVWSGVYKGAANKQYAAQISLVINTEAGGLDIGFYFGRTSAMGLSNDQRDHLEGQLKQLGKLLYYEVENNILIKEAFNKLIELGFTTETKNKRVSPSVWLKEINESPSHSSITITVKPDDNNMVSFSTIDAYIALVMPLMISFPENISTENSISKNKLPKPLTPEQRAKQAEMRALIGIKGEELVFAFEKQRLSVANLITTGYPSHQSLISDVFHYDILSRDSDSDIFIEVKTTTRQKKDAYSKIFYMSNHEYKFFQDNIKNFRLYRVYDVYGEPEIEIIDISNIKPEVDTYRINLNQHGN
ncbi:MAG: DUF3883 domain-containing protein [Flavobacterium sp.]|nr:MAG: DUF3883 domain-containing protein [Flavobacterium sp.]